MVDDLLQVARAAREKAHAPYSNFKVGAAMRAESGQVYGGCNVENAAFPEGICAEGGAITSMVAAGDKAILEVLIYAEADTPTAPCGGCRQKIAEFALPDTSIRLYSPDALRAVFSLAELLPYSFTPEHLN